MYSTLVSVLLSQANALVPYQLLNAGAFTAGVQTSFSSSSLVTAFDILLEVRKLNWISGIQSLSDTVSTIQYSASSKVHLVFYKVLWTLKVES
jgi:hypothetical protein